MMNVRLAATLLASTFLLGGCITSEAPRASMVTQASFPKKTTTQQLLNELPPPARPVTVAVYSFTDQTGQFKLQSTGQTLSRAVTQGAGSILVKALQDAGDRKWFTVVEREQLKDLLNERQIITEMRARYLGETGLNPQALPALLFAGVLLEGGIISYDTNTLTSGAGAGILGIELSGNYNQDTVTVYLRAVSVKTGEVLATVTTTKTITSKALTANLFAYVSSDKIAEGELGYTTNEPAELALQQAIEKAVYGLVLEGVDLKLWNFADTSAGWPVLWRYKQERDGVISAAQAEAILRAARGNKGPALGPQINSAPDHAKPAADDKSPAAAQERRRTGSTPQVRTAETDRPSATPTAPSGTTVLVAPSSATTVVNATAAKGA